MVDHRPPTYVKHDLLTINRQAYVEFPLQAKTLSFKPDVQVIALGAKLEGASSYKRDFPPKQGEAPQRQPNKAIQSTVRQSRSVPRENYITMNQAMLKEWKGHHAPMSYGEPDAINMFSGEFNGESTFQKDYNKDVAKLGRPSTTCRLDQKLHISNGEFSEDTTNKISFKLPEIVSRDKIHHRNESKKNQSTLGPSGDKMESRTQYQRDNPSYRGKFPAKRPKIDPQPDTLQLFTGSHKIVSENRASYNPDLLKDAPRPRSSCKIEETAHSNGGKFDGLTSFKNDYKPIKLDEILAQSEIDRQAMLNARNHKHGWQARLAYDFGQGVSHKTTNNSHFREWKVVPRIRFGDPTEKTYYPSNAPFKETSEMRSSYVAMDSEPAESCKPLNVRFKQEQGSRQAFDGVTAYNEHFLPKQLPSKEMCPAELLLA